MKNTVLITGSYGGLGTYLAEIHAENSGDLILVGRSHDKLDSQKKQLMNQYHIVAENDDKPCTIISKETDA